MNKVTFHSTNKNIPGFPLSVITTVSVNVQNNNLNERVTTRQKIEEYKSIIEQIRDSKTGVKVLSKGEKLKLDRIKVIYRDIFGKAPTSSIVKNELIDIIVKYLSQYVSATTSSTVIKIDVEETQNDDLRYNDDGYDSDDSFTG